MAGKGRETRRSWSRGGWPGMVRNEGAADEIRQEASARCGGRVRSGTPRPTTERRGGCPPKPSSGGQRHLGQHQARRPRGRAMCP
eukprot:1069888-Alexandrium_andersonii.AAC.1